MWKAEGIRPEFFDEFTGVVSEEHFMHTLERVKKHQQNKDTLETLGWGGVCIEVGAFILDPVSWTGYGASAKLLKPLASKNQDGCLGNPGLFLDPSP